LLNQIQLPLSVPLLKAFLSFNCAVHHFVTFIPNEHVNAISFRKSFSQVILMLPNTLYEIRGDPDVKSSITTAGKHVNAWEFHLGMAALDSRFRGNDVRQALNDVQASMRSGFKRVYPFPCT
jgi:hypothetical protein